MLGQPIKVQIYSYRVEDKEESVTLWGWILLDQGDVIDRSGLPHLSKDLAEREAVKHARDFIQGER